MKRLEAMPSEVEKWGSVLAGNGWDSTITMYP